MVKGSLGVVRVSRGFAVPFVRLSPMVLVHAGPESLLAGGAKRCPLLGAVTPGWDVPHGGGVWRGMFSVLFPSSGQRHCSCLAPLARFIGLKVDFSH